MRVMITGAFGMVGHNLLERLADEPHEVLAPKRTELDLFDYIAVENYINYHQPELIIHAAGKVGGIQANIKDPVQFLVENLDMGRNVVMAAYKLRVKKFLNLGSSCMYPHNALNPLKEENILQGELEPTNEGYALAKVTIGRLCKYISRKESDLQYKTLIPCNLYGRWDKFDPEHSHLIPAVIHKLHQAHKYGDKDVSIWGDGSARREFMYAGDLADCLCRSIEQFEILPLVMNVGLGHDYTINEYYAAVAKVVGYQGCFTYDVTKPVGMKQKLVDTTKMNLWGWHSRTNLLAGIQKTYDFYLQQGYDVQ